MIFQYKQQKKEKIQKKNLSELNSNTLEPQLTLLTTTLWASHTNYASFEYIYGVLVDALSQCDIALKCAHIFMDTSLYVMHRCMCLRVSAY
jgi:hypothetical protein